MLVECSCHGDWLAGIELWRTPHSEGQSKGILPTVVSNTKPGQLSCRTEHPSAEAARAKLQAERKATQCGNIILILA